MQNSSKDLCLYRVQNAIETLETAKMCIETKHYKDVIAYFNKTYVATEVFEKTVGRMLAQLQLKREKSDYDDFYVVSKEEAETQYQNAIDIFNVVKKYLSEKYEIVDE